MEAHRGARVVWLSAEEIAEIFEIRAILVTAAIRKVIPSLTHEQLAQLEQIAQQQEVRGTSAAVRARLNHAFNSILFAPLNRPRLLALMDRLEKEVDRYLMSIPDRPRMGRRELVAACRERNADRAAEVLHRYLERAAECAVKRVRELDGAS
jgi:DNA-binding GntR family transcriptional regulator